MCIEGDFFILLFLLLFICFIILHICRVTSFVPFLYNATFSTCKVLLFYITTVWDSDTWFPIVY